MRCEASIGLPAAAVGALAAIGLAEDGFGLRARIQSNAALFRLRMTEEGFDLLPSVHPIMPVMLGDAATATRLADALLRGGIYVTAFSYPVVPRAEARIRVQISAAHKPEDIEACVRAFVTVRGEIAHS